MHTQRHVCSKFVKLQLLLMETAVVSSISFSVSVHYSLWIDRNLRFGILRRRRRRLTRNSRTKQSHYPSIHSPSLGRSLHVIIIFPAVSIHHRHKGRKEGEGNRRRGGRANEKPIRSAAATEHFARSVSSEQQVDPTRCARGKTDQQACLLGRNIFKDNMLPPTI